MAAPRGRGAPRRCPRPSRIDQRPGGRVGQHDPGHAAFGQLDHDQQQERGHDLPPDAETAVAAQKQGGEADQRHRNADQGLREARVQVIAQLRRAGAGALHHGRGAPQQLGGAGELHLVQPPRRLCDQVADIVREIIEMPGVEPAPPGAHGLRHPVDHDQLGAGLVLHEVGAGRGVDDRALRVAPVRQEHLAQLALRGDVADVEGDARRRMQELAVLQEPRGHVLAHIGLALAQLAQAERDQQVAQQGHDQRDDHAERQRRPRQPHGRVAGGLHHGQLALRAQPVGDLHGGGEGCQRQHHADHAR